MKIWVIGRSYPMSINNMQGSFELEQAKMLAKYGHQVAYIACVFHPFKKVKKWGSYQTEEDGVKIYTFSQFFTIERMKLHFEAFKSLIWRRHLKTVLFCEGVPDIIHVHYPTNITVSKEILKFKNIGSKIICTEHWSQVLKKSIDSYERNQLKDYADNADVFLCVGGPLRDAVKELTNTNRDISVIPNIINPYFIPASKKHAFFSFVAVGALFPIKQFDKIIAAFAEEFPNDAIKLTIVGSGPEGKRLKKLVKSYDLEEKVLFTGKLSRRETARIMGESDVLINYSRYETFCVPVIEAWACGIPVIASTEIAVNDMWDSRLGIQVSPDDVSALRNAMRTVYQSIGDYNKTFINNYAISNYSEKVVYDKLLSYYENC